MAKTTTREQDTGFRENQIIVAAKRALGLNKFYLAVAIAIGLGVLFFLNPTLATSSTSSNNSTNISSATSSPLPLFAVPFTVVPMMMLTTPMVVLFVYDKNNGVLEYLISLGMTQGDIFARYLKAALLVAVSYLLIFGTLNLLYSFVRFGTTYLSTMLVILGNWYAHSSIDGGFHHDDDDDLQLAPEVKERRKPATGSFAWLCRSFPRLLHPFYPPL